MKIIRTLLFAFSLITLPVIIESCCMTGTSCCNLPEPKKFTVNDITLKVTTFNGTDYVTAPQSIKPKEMTFNFNLAVTNLAMGERMIRPTMSAYACDPVPDSSKEKINEFTITSDQPLVVSEQLTIPAGSDLSSGFSLGQSFQGDYFYLRAFNMVPNFPVQTSQDHEFTFRFTLDDGRVFELRSGVHTLLP
jgi:hypothetical protein